MSAHDQSTMTDRSRNSASNCRLTLKDGLQFISSLLLPLMLGVFTVMITLEQQRISQEQRKQDLAELRVQREEDMNNSMLQRALDKQIAKEQREEDERRRIQDLNISESKRTHDDELAGKQRDLLEKQKLHELAVEAQRHQDTLLVAYMNEVGVLLERNNGCLSGNPLTATVVRAKTLTLARQIDSKRNTQVIQFLYEAGQLTDGQHPLDLRDAEFNGIDLSSTIFHSKMHGLYLFGARLSNASFENRDLTNANFSEAYLQDASFVKTFLNHVDFSHAILVNTNFHKSLVTKSVFDAANIVRIQASDVSFDTCQFIGATIREIYVSPITSFYYCNFTNVADLYRMNFTNVLFQFPYFQNGNIRESIFAGASLGYAKFVNMKLSQNDFSRIDGRNSRFINVELNNSVFTNSILEQSVWLNSHIINSSFEYANLIDASFEDTHIENVNFVKATITEVSFSDVSLTMSNFSRCICNDIRFDDSSIRNVSFHNATLMRSNFSSVKLLSHVDFTCIDGRDSDFSSVNLITQSFEGAQLARASFAWSLCDEVNFNHADLTDVDMSHASLRQANLTREQFNKALSISATFFEGKKHRNPNLLVNCLASCNTSILSVDESVWKVKPRETNVKIFHLHNTSCHFASVSNMTQPVIMSQLVSISRYQRLIAGEKAHIYVAINVWNSTVTVYLTAFGPKHPSVNHTFHVMMRSGQQLLQPVYTPPLGITQLLLSIVFESNTSRCSHIDLSVQHKL